MADVACRVVGQVGRIHLNRPKALNALTHAMVRQVSTTLAAWRDDPTVIAVLVTGEGERAFCAGGDVLHVARLAREEGAAAAAPFFFDEYRMNWRIRRFPKPYVALIDGITMGGGVGISVHGSHRIATEATTFAMPETAIGMFPDVGGTYVLGQMPGGLGRWLALTGHRLGPVETVEAGIATHYVPRAKLAELEARLLGASDAAAIDAAVTELAEDPGSGEIATRRPLIDRVFDHAELGAIADAARAEPSGWGASQWQTIERHSPTAIRVAFEQSQRELVLDFDAAMRLEYRGVNRVLQDHDFFEGVRAMLVDRDRQPRWRPTRLAEVSETVVQAHFAPLPEGDLPLDWND